MKLYHLPEFRRLPLAVKLELLPLEVLVTAVVSYEAIGYSPLFDLTVNELRQHHGLMARQIQDVIDARMKQLHAFATNVGTGAINILQNRYPTKTFTRDHVRSIGSFHDKMAFLLSPELFSDDYVNRTWPHERFPGIQKSLWLLRDMLSRTATGDYPVHVSADETAMYGRHNVQLNMEAFVYRMNAETTNSTSAPENELSTVTPAMLLVRKKKDIFGKAVRSLGEESILERGDIWKEETRMDIFDKAVPRDLLAITFNDIIDEALYLSVIRGNLNQLASTRLFPGTRIRLRSQSAALPFPHQRMYVTQPATGVESHFVNFVRQHYRGAQARSLLADEPRDHVEVMALQHRDAVFAELDPRFEHDKYAELRKIGFRHPETGAFVDYDQRHKSLIKLVSEPGFSLRR